MKKNKTKAILQQDKDGRRVGVVVEEEEQPQRNQ